VPPHGRPTGHEGCHDLFYAEADLFHLKASSSLTAEPLEDENFHYLIIRLASTQQGSTEWKACRTIAGKEGQLQSWKEADPIAPYRSRGTAIRF
jgi:hypothetical protein